MNKVAKGAAGVAAAAVLTLGLVKTFEGNSTKAYMDANHTPTICRGHTKGVFIGMTVTQEQCEAWATKEIQDRLDAVDRMLLQPQPDTRRAALADFAYNEGVGALQNSVALRLINQGKLVDGCLALFEYVRAGNQVLLGLVRRRVAEVRLCLVGTSP